MSPRAVLVLLVLLVGGVVWLLWFDQRRPDSEEEPPVAGLIDPVPESVRAIEIVYRDVEGRLDRGVDGGWRVTRPVAWEADPAKVGDLLRDLSGVEVLRIVADDPDVDLGAFGLAPPEGRLILFTHDDEPARRLDLGGVSPVGDERYVRDESGAVLLVESSLARILARRPEFFVERRFVPVDSDDVRAISVRGPATGLRLERRDPAWWLTDPVEDLADPGIVTEMIEALAELEASELLDAEEIGLAGRAFGAAVRVTVEVGDGDGPLGVEIGSPAGPDRWFARRPGHESFWGIVEARSIRLLVREADDLRERRLALFSRPEVLEVRIRSTEGGLTLARDDARGWNAREGDGTAVDLEGEAVETFLDRLRWLRATSFGDGVGRPAGHPLEIILKGESDELGRLSLQPLTGTRSPEGLALLRARTSWRPGLSFTVAADSLGAVPRTVSDLRNLSEEPHRGDRKE